MLMGLQINHKDLLNTAIIILTIFIRNCNVDCEMMTILLKNSYIYLQCKTLKFSSLKTYTTPDNTIYIQI